MNVLPFEIKRAHWGMTWTAIKRFRTEGRRRRPELLHMTPLRFEILYLIHMRWLAFPDRTPDVRPGIALADLVEKIGFSKVTIARCVRRIAEEEIGYVRREKSAAGGRRIDVVLTEEGEKAVLSALELLGLRPNFLVERFDWWQKKTGLVPAEEMFERWVEQARKLARLFGSKGHPIYVRAYDHRAHYKPFEKDPDEPEWGTGPVLSPRHARGPAARSGPRRVRRS